MPLEPLPAEPVIKRRRRPAGIQGHSASATRDEVWYTTVRSTNVHLKCSADVDHRHRQFIKPAKEEDIINFGNFEGARAAGRPICDRYVAASDSI